MKSISFFSAVVRFIISGLVSLLIGGCANVYYDRDPYGSTFLMQNFDAKQIHLPSFRVAALVSSEVIMKMNSHSLTVTVFNMKNSKGNPYFYKESFLLQSMRSDHEKGLRVNIVGPNQRLYVFKISEDEHAKVDEFMKKLRSIPESDKKAAFGVTPSLVRCATNGSGENNDLKIYFSFTSGFEYSRVSTSTETKNVLRTEACLP